MGSKRLLTKISSGTLVALLITAVSFSSCKKDETPAPQANISKDASTAVTSKADTTASSDTSGQSLDSYHHHHHTGDTTTPTTGTTGTTTAPKTTGGSTTTGTTTTAPKTTTGSGTTTTTPKTPATGTGTGTGTTTGTKTTTGSGTTTTAPKTPATGTTPVTGSKTTTTGTTNTAPKTTGTGTTTTKPTTGTKAPAAGAPGATAPATTPAATKSAYKYSGPISMQNKSNLVISGDSINGGSGPCITLTNCTNVHITKCKLQNGNTVLSTGVNLNGCTNVTIDYCFITKVATGVYAQNSKQIIVDNNQFLNMMGPYPRGAYVQFNGVSGSGNRITNNKGENVAGQSNPEDGINVFKSNGVASDPILVSGNMLRGGGPSVTGSGITVGDQGGSYITVTNNTVVNTGNVGMQVAGGTYIIVTNNNIYSTATSLSHLGLGYGNYSGKATNNVTMSGNKIKWMSGKAADLAYYPKGTKSIEKDVSIQSGLTTPIGWTTNILGATITSSILPTSLITMK